MLIVLDPGHGGEDSGATGNGLTEKEINLTLAKLVQAELAAYQTAVLLTRDGDINVGLSARAELANKQHANFFLSLHVNAGGGSGFESYIHPRATAETENLRKIIHQGIARFYAGRGFADRGMKTADFAVLRETDMPAVLLENLFIDNPRDAACLADSAFLKALAGAVADSLAQALHLKRRSGWDPAAEIRRLQERGLISDLHDPGSTVTWGELAAVCNRLLDRMEHPGASGH